MKRAKLLILLCASLVLCSCGSVKSDGVYKVVAYETEVENSTEITDEYDTSSSTETEPIKTLQEPKVETYNLSLIAVGDNLIHSPIYKKAKQADGSYDFSSMYANIKDTIQSYDLAVINQETIYVNDEANVSSYPCFGTPSSMGDTLVDVGFDVILNATNHTWDKRSTGYENTINFWKKYPEITTLGIHEDENDFNTVDIVEKNGFKLAMFNYTYGLNGFTLPSDKQYAVDLLDNKEKFIADLQRVEHDVDFSICFLHIGNEYVYEPTTYQVDYVNDIIDAGADIVICSHPHVVEPYDLVTTENGNSAIVYYSCGNFISGQNEVPRVLGGMAELNLTKTVTDGVVTSCEVSDYDFEPIITHYNSTEHTIYKLEDYTEDLAKTHSLASKGLSVEKLWNLWEEITVNN